MRDGHEIDLALGIERVGVTSVAGFRGLIDLRGSGATEPRERSGA